MEKVKENSLLSQWKQRRKDAIPEGIKKAPKDVPLVLSYMQQRLWFLQQLHKGNPFYNYADVYRLSGPLEITELQKALQLIYESHDVLRSIYSLENGQPEIRILPADKLNVLTYDLSTDPSTRSQKSIDKILNTDANRAFDLEIGPLIRISLLKLSDTEHILLLTLHHIITDKWSMGILRRQFAKYYRALILKQEVAVEVPPIQYHDYAYWLQHKVVPDIQIDYWKKKLSGEIPVLDLPKDFPPPAQPSYKGAFNVRPLSDDLSKAVLSLSSELETTPYVLLLSAYFVLLYRYSGQNDILIGSPISNRDQKALESLIGFFNDTVVLRSELNSEMSFRDLVKMVRKITMEAFANKDAPFDVLVKELKPQRSLRVNPFFQVMFLYHPVPPAPDLGPDLELVHAPYDAKVAKFDLTLFISKDDESLTSIFEYATDLFSEETIMRFHDYFSSLLEGATNNPELAVSKIPMITSSEEKFFVSGLEEEMEEPKVKKPIHRFIEEIAKKTPAKKALIYKGDSIDYDKLNQRANKIAHRILDKTQGRNEIVGLCIDRSLDMIIGMLAILKSGCAYLPMDPEYPEQRIKFMLNDADVHLILTNEPAISIVEQDTVEVLYIDSVTSNTINNSSDGLPDVKPDDIAYVIYTSGSTGRPKGVPISHKNIVNSTLGRTEFYDSNPESFLLLSSIAFDSSKAGIFWTLSTGATLVISEKRMEQDIDSLAKTIQQHKVSHTLMLPSLYNLLLDHATVSELQSLSTIMVAGEACPTTLAAKHFTTLPKAHLYNEYGPTEATVWCVAHKITIEDLQNTIPIGKPVANAQAHILNDNFEEVPYGAVGELCISGGGLTKGYINLPDSNAECFIDIPQKPYSSSMIRVYRTGDLARYGQNGNIQFLGRKDQQVKVRGFRIELDEIEKVILNNELVQKVVVSIESEHQKLGLKEIEDLEINELIEKAAKRMGLDELKEILLSVESLSDKEQDFLSNEL